MIFSCFLMLFCLVYKSVPENRHICVNKGLTYLTLSRIPRRYWKPGKLVNLYGPRSFSKLSKSVLHSVLYRCYVFAGPSGHSYHLQTWYDAHLWHTTSKLYNAEQSRIAHRVNITASPCSGSILVIWAYTHWNHPMAFTASVSVVSTLIRRKYPPADFIWAYL